MNNERGTSFLVSVVIPIYNVEAYLERTLLSVANQSYKHIEVVMVDDGSTDDSGVICRKQADKDRRFKYIFKENGGLSSSRNVGMKSVSGDYVTFLDGDDVLSPLAIESMLSLAMENDVQLVSCALKKVSDGEELYKDNETCVRLVTAKEHLEMFLLLDDETGSACGKLFGKELFKYLVFPEGQLFEDFGIVSRCIFFAGKSVVSSAKVYGYTTRVGSITGISSYGFKHMDGMEQSLRIVRDVISDDEDLKKLYPCYEATCYLRVASKLSKEECQDEALFYEYVSLAKNSARQAIKQSEMRTVWKARCFLFSISRNAHNVLYGLYGKITGKTVS